MKNTIIWIEKKENVPTTVRIITPKQQLVVSMTKQVLGYAANDDKRYMAMKLETEPGENIQWNNPDAP